MKVLFYRTPGPSPSQGEGRLTKDRYGWLDAHKVDAFVIPLLHKEKGRG